MAWRADGCVGSGCRRVIALLHAVEQRVNSKRVELIWRVDGLKSPKKRFKYDGTGLAMDLAFGLVASFCTDGSFGTFSVGRRSCSSGGGGTTIPGGRIDQGGSRHPPREVMQLCAVVR